MKLAFTLLLCAFAAAEDSRDFFSTDKSPQQMAVAANRAWMKRLPDNKKLSELSIPGTHDTCARFGGDFAQCQSLALRDQFSIGLRFLDIRCRRRGKRRCSHC